MWRSRWYDLFSAEDRVEAMRGIWAVLGLLMRRTPHCDGDKQPPGSKQDDGEQVQQSVAVAPGQGAMRQQGQEKRKRDAWGNTGGGGGSSSSKSA